jgi:MFS family permease
VRVTGAIREHPALRALAVPNFRRYFLGDLVSMTGGFVQSISLVWLILELGGNAFDIALMLSIQNFPSLVLAPVGGTIADRFDNRKLLIGLQVFGAAQAVAIATLTATGVVTIGWIMVSASVLGLWVAFHFPAANALRYELVTAGELSSAIGLGSMTMSVGRLLGPMVAGVLLAISDVATACYVDASTFLFFIVMLLLVRPSELRERRAVDRTSVTLGDGFRYAWRRPDLRLVLAAVALISMLAYNMNLLTPAMTRIEFGGSSTAYAVVAATTGFAGLVGGLAAATIAWPTLRIWGLLGLAFGTPLLLSSLSPGVLVFAVFFAGVGLASAAFWAVAQMYLQHRTEGEFQGRVMSLYTMAWGGTTIFGALAIGALIDAVSPRAALVVGGVVTLTVSALVLWWARRSDHAVRSEEAQTTIGRLPSPRTLLE